jgi:hypothetical protein
LQIEKLGGYSPDFQGEKMIQTAGLITIEIFRDFLDEELEIVAGFCREEYLPQKMSIIHAGV